VIRAGYCCDAESSVIAGRAGVIIERARLSETLPIGCAGRSVAGGVPCAAMSVAASVRLLTIVDD